jgi:hypothetical protein
MDTVLGLLGVVVFIVAVISLAAAVTWLVVKLLPQRDKDEAQPQTR